MGLKEMRENAKWFALYETHKVSNGEYSFLPDGKFKKVRRPIAGAVAEYEAGSSVGGRTTLTRVAAGALLAGPAGAIVGGMFKKDVSKGYVTTTFPDGTVVILEGPLKDESKLRQFAAKVNAAAAHYAE